MKKGTVRSCSAAMVLAAGLFAATLPAAGQSILININQTDPSAVTFTTTSANSFVNNSSAYNLYGADLIGYFTAAPVIVAGTVTGTLTPAGTTTAYTTWIPDNLYALSALDLNLYTTSNPQLQNFSTSSPAFAGTAIINLSALLASLPSTGATGNIYSGNISSPGALIGTWVVVPEPSVEAQLAFGAMVLAGLAFVRRSRRAAACR
jgi:MYXO-CTERM domain-containing protein